MHPEYQAYLLAYRSTPEYKARRKIQMHDYRKARKKARRLEALMADCPL